MGTNVSIPQEISHFKEIWEYRSPNHSTYHTKEIWDQRAHEWERKLQAGESLERSEKRVMATAEYLRFRGLLGGGSDVIDIGCGPGRFVAEFARTANHAVGTDLSGQMLRYGEQFARSNGIENTSYVEADFQTADIEALGWKHRFDLVFSSITPAISGDGMGKLMEMSRGWCFNSCFVNFRDEISDALAENILGSRPSSTPNGHWHWFYALLNLLLLRGYYPETTYYRETKTVTAYANEESAREWARDLAREHGADEDALYEPVLRYFCEHAQDGVLTGRNDCLYGWILWNVNGRADAEW